MAKKKREPMKTHTKLYIAIAVIIVLVIIAEIISLISENKTVSLDTDEEIEAYIEQNITDTLKDMEERDRMEYYVNIFLGYIENEDYESAYELLYEDFKENYFPTLEDFAAYCPTVFSEMNDIEHTNIERNGDVYVLWIEITDAVNGKVGESQEMNIVIQEYDYNDFVLSFSVI